jgi:hypothetical protein
MVGQGREEDFQKVFAADGIWPELLRRSEGYLETDWKLESEAERCYRVRDYWKSHKSFEQFRGQYREECERFSRWIAGEGLVERETILGSFYEDGPEESGLVLR